MHSIVVELWDEWFSLPQENEESDSSEAAGLLAGLQVKKGEVEGNVSLVSSRLMALRRLMRLWKNSQWRTELNLAARIVFPQNMKGRVQLVLPESLYRAVIGFNTASFASPSNWAWARGLWGSCGALYVPKSGYYLVMRIAAQDVAKRMGQTLQKAHISWGERTVHGMRELILRDQQEIVAFLNKIDLSGVSLRMEDKAILRSMRDQANRVRNCDTANIKKSLRVAEEQVDLALRLKNGGLLAALPAHFKSLAEARLEHPEASLSELGDVLSPPVTKSTVKYRWKRLCEFVGEYSGPPK